MARPLITIEQRWALIDKNGPIPKHIPAYGPCWIWHGPTRKSNGGLYGFFGRQTKAWWWTWEQSNGSVPKGLTLDHLCRNTLCVRPSHLEPVTLRVNILRGIGIAARYASRTHCDHGHAYTTENTRITKAGARLCRTCRRITSREEKVRARARRLAVT